MFHYLSEAAEIKEYSKYHINCYRIIVVFIKIIRKENFFIASF